MLEKAVMADYDALCELYRAACEGMERSGLDLWHWGMYPSPDILREDIENGWLYLCREGGDILGCLALNRVADPAYKTIAWQYPGQVGLFHRVAVSPSAQGRGVARQMLRDAEDILRADGCTVLRGDVSVINLKAQRLYDRMGMRRAGTLTLDGVKDPFYALEKQL